MCYICKVPTNNILLHCVANDVMGRAEGRELGRLGYRVPDFPINCGDLIGGAGT